MARGRLLIPPWWWIAFGVAVVSTSAQWLAAAYDLGPGWPVAMFALSGLALGGLVYGAIVLIREAHQLAARAQARQDLWQETALTPLLPKSCCVEHAVLHAAQERLRAGHRDDGTP